MDHSCSETGVQRIQQGSRRHGLNAGIPFCEAYSSPMMILHLWVLHGFRNACLYLRLLWEFGHPSEFD